MQKLQLSIPEPCHENWQNMTPTDQGRFCNACAKEVIDFSTMTDIQVLNYFTNITHEKVCGRALPEQLERTISRPEQPKKRLFWYWNYVVMFFMIFTKGNMAKAQGGIKPVTEMNPVNNLDVRGEIMKREKSRAINGKVTDANGNPVSFASIKIKGTNGGVSADANGKYSLRIRVGAILEIAGASFKTVEVPVGTLTLVDIVMESSGMPVKEVVVTVGGAIRRTARCGTSSVKTSVVNPIMVFEVKEDNNGLPIDKAVITITKKGNLKSDTAINEEKGFYKYNEIIEGENYFIKVESAGYETNEFTIDATDFKDRKKEWEVLLRKQKVVDGGARETTINKALAGAVTGASVRSKAEARLGTPTTVRMGGISALKIGNEPLYVVDGTIMPQKNDINPDDIDDITVLQGPAATALFGPDGANGAIVITTRKAKEKKLDTVTVNAQYGHGCRGRRLGATSVYSITGISYLADTKARIMTVLTDSLKVYPNPVMQNSSFSIALKLKDAGEYQLKISDASGRVVFQKQFITTAKKHTETVQQQNWAAGIYYLRVLNKNKLISNTSFILE